MSKKLAIAMFGQKRLSREGGVEIVVKELCTRMAQNGCDVTCYNRAGHHVSGAEYDDAGKTEYEGIRQKSVPTIERRGLAAVSSSAFAALYSAFGKYDVVHIHAEGPAFFAWLPKMFGKRVVVTVHGIDWQREKWQSGLGSKFIHQGEKNAAKYADEVIVLSKGVQDYFKETYGRKTHFIPNGVNRPQTREASLIADKFGLKKDSYILFLGRLVPEKGIRYLVEAFRNVKTDKKLVIAGGSSDTDSFMEELKDLAKGDDRILFTGFVQGAMLDELYSNAYIYTLPSDLEGMPLSLLEAMSYGNCCLVFQIYFEMRGGRTYFDEGLALVCMFYVIMLLLKRRLDSSDQISVFLLIVVIAIGLLSNAMSGLAYSWLLYLQATLLVFYSYNWSGYLIQIGFVVAVFVLYFKELTGVARKVLSRVKSR